MVAPRETERAVIGSLIAGTGNPLAIEHADLTDPRLQDILAIIKKLDEPPSLLAVRNAIFRYASSGEEASDLAVLVPHLLEASVAAENFPALIRRLHENRRLRELKLASLSLAQSLDDGAEDAELRDLAARIDTLARSTNTREPAHLSIGMGEVFSVADRPECPTGLADLANLRILGGNLVVAAARPGMGKSALLGTFSLAAAKSGWNVLFLSLEMPTLEIRQRLIAGFSSIPLRTIQENTNPGVIHEAELLSKLPIWLEDESRGRLNLENISAMTASFVRSRPNEKCVLVLDYLQLITSRLKHERRYELIGHVCRELKHLALSLEIPILTAAQLSRAAEERSGRPQLSDLRESGEIEQTADKVLLIHRDESGDHIRIAKNRMGPLWTARPQFTGEICLFEDRIGDA